MTPYNLSLGNLSDLIIAWAWGSISEGQIAKATGMDRLSLRGLRSAAINSAMTLCELPDSLAAGVSTTAPSASSAEITGGIAASPSSLPTAEKSDALSLAAMKSTPTLRQDDVEDIAIPHTFEELKEYEKELTADDLKAFGNLPSVKSLLKAMDIVTESKGALVPNGRLINLIAREFDALKTESSAKDEAVQRVVEAARVAVDHRKWWGTTFQPQFEKKYPRYEKSLRTGTDVFQELETALLVIAPPQGGKETEGGGV